jgi:hypothetical protein
MTQQASDWAQEWEASSGAVSGGSEGLRFLDRSVASSSLWHEHLGFEGLYQAPFLFKQTRVPDVSTFPAHWLAYLNSTAARHGSKSIALPIVD